MTQATQVIHVGDISISAVVECDSTLFGALDLFPDATEASLSAESAWMVPSLYDPDSKAFKSLVQGFVFRADGKTVLVDTCVGNDKPGRSRPDWTLAKFPFLENLAGAGYSPEDIDVVLCTHLHLDHTGWNTRLDNGRWVPTFPNAEYLSNAVELAALEKRRAGSAVNRLVYEDSILPVIQSGQLSTVAMDHRLSGSVALEPSPGHTAGHVSVRVSAGGESAVAIGDMMHHPIQALHPDWNSRHCEDPAQARKTRRAFLEQVADTGTWILPAHFAPCRACRDGKAFRFNLGG